MSTPFHVDPEVMGRIRPMMAVDAGPVAELHHAAMGSSLWAQLGVSFLSMLYRNLVNDHRFLAFVYVADGEVQGFIAGSQDTEAMLELTLRRSWFLVGPAAIPGMLRRPRIIKKLLQTRDYAQLSQVPGTEDVAAESLFCSFMPALRGKRISGHINKVLFDELLSRGHSHVKVTTEIDNEGANRQLQSWGFVDRGRFNFYGKEMVVYTLDLEASPRVDALSRHHAI